MNFRLIEMEQTRERVQASHTEREMRGEYDEKYNIRLISTNIRIIKKERHLIYINK